MKRREKFIEKHGITEDELKEREETHNAGAKAGDLMTKLVEHHD